MDAITSFVYLTDTLPDWIQQVRDLSTHASKKHAEYVAEYTRRVNHIRPKKERTLSNHTPKNEPAEPPPEILERPAESTPEPSAPSPLHIPLEAGNRYLLAQTQRKRKLGPSIRSGASGPQKFRSKHMLVIYYDAYLQEQLDALVKGIGGARNNLRKGKLSRSASRGFQLPCFGRASSQGNYGIPSLYGPKDPPTYLSVPTDSKGQSANRQSTTDEAFTNADKHLEGAQSLCETAAHQVLRDGDCSVELNTVITKLEGALKIATATVVQLREEEAEQREQAENQTQTDAETAPLTDTSSSPSLTNSSMSKLAPSLSEKMEFPPPTLAIGSGGVTEIEVDDESDQESIVVDISKFRIARTRSHGLRCDLRK